MAISFELPTEVERHLREKLSDLDQVAKESALVELYRQGKLSHHELAMALGLAGWSWTAYCRNTASRKIRLRSRNSMIRSHRSASQAKTRIAVVEFSHNLCENCLARVNEFGSFLDIRTPLADNPVQKENRAMAEKTDRRSFLNKALLGAAGVGAAASLEENILLAAVDQGQASPPQGQACRKCPSRTSIRPTCPAARSAT